MRILIVEDEEDLGATLSDELCGAGHRVDLARGGAQADRLMSAAEYDLVVLEMKIPPSGALKLLGRWRRAGVSTPLLLLTADGAVRDTVRGLDLGADDCLSKPFDISEFLARVRALLRRGDTPMRSLLTAGDVIMDRGAREVRVAGKLVHFTPKEYALLESLMLNKGRAVSRSELFESVWGHPFDPGSNVVDVVIHRLRVKIDHARDDKLLRTIVSVGYSINGERTRDPR